MAENVATADTVASGRHVLELGGAWGFVDRKHLDDLAFSWSRRQTEVNRDRTDEDIV